MVGEGAGMGKGEMRTVSFFFLHHKGLEVPVLRIEGAHPRRLWSKKMRHDSKPCPVLLGGKKNLKGKKTIGVDRMFPITGEPENRKWVGGGVWRGCANIWRGWGRVGGEKRHRRVKYKK